MPCLSSCSILQQFQLYARDVARASQASARSKYEVAESMGLSTTSIATDKDLEFPFVTIPNFEVQAGNARELSDTDLLVYCPLVTRGEQQTEWETYSSKNQGWLGESLDFLGMVDVNPGLIPNQIYGTRDFSSPSYNDGMHPDLLDTMAPLWYVFSTVMIGLRLYHL